MIIAKNLDKIFRQGENRVHAVKDVCFESGKGERIFIHGPSGAGKSTLLHMLGALSRPSRGSVTFSESDIYRMSDRKRSRLRNRNFGFIFQFYHLLSELNVMENVMLPARIGGGATSREIRFKVLDIIERVKMSHRINHKPFQLSGGESQRVAIARALVNSPDILFCDEPTGNLDSEMSAGIYDLIKEISMDNGMTVIVVSHQGVREGFFNRKFFMKDGFLSETGAGAHNLDAQVVR